VVKVLENISKEYGLLPCDPSNRQNSCSGDEDVDRFQSIHFESRQELVHMLKPLL